MDAPHQAPGQDRQPDRARRALQGRDQGQAGAQGPLTAGAPRHFRFVQWEFAGHLGAPAGRYVVRRYAGDEVREVVVVTESEAPRRRLRRGAPAGTVPITRVTVIDASRSDDFEAEDWRARASACVSRFLSAHRVASADARVPDAGSALVVRIGMGTGEQLAAGEWTTVEELPAPEAPRARRRSKHRPGERLAAVMAARDVTLACEELTVRARGDLEAGRESEAVLQLEAALTTALAELAGWVEYGDVGERAAELRSHEIAVRAAAAAAREGRLEGAHVEAATAALARLEAALRARALYAAE